MNTYKTPIEEEIAHLDFEPERRTRHFGHPIDPKKSWCEKQAYGKGSFSTRRTGKVKEVDCVECLQLAISKGFGWWWNIHNAYHQSVCTSGNHKCNA